MKSSSSNTTSTDGVEPSPRDQLYARLLGFATGRPNDDLLARILASQRCGGGALAEDLGLGEAAFRHMAARHFPGSHIAGRLPIAGDDGRSDERSELLTLLLAHRADLDESETWVARIVTAACMANDHLWQDLGLWSRKDLSRLMTENFPALAAKNVKDMKWKKFLYKQLCIQEGVYTCRAPSCEQCNDYDVCFGPEE